jgi:prepilin-type N-terminal cleavage/methylation domain-containing protein
MTGRAPVTGRPWDAGLTLVEVLVVVIVLGVLSAIAVPVHLVQRGKAADAGTKRDLASVAKLVIATFADSRTPSNVRIVGSRYEVDSEDVGPVSRGVVVAGADPANADVTGWTEDAWCFALTNPGGRVADFRYSAQEGLQPGRCASPVTP